MTCGTIFFLSGHFNWINVYVMLRNPQKESFKEKILLGNKALCTLDPYPVCKQGAEHWVGSHCPGLGNEGYDACSRSTHRKGTCSVAVLSEPRC